MPAPADEEPGMRHDDGAGFIWRVSGGTVCGAKLRYFSRSLLGEPADSVVLGESGRPIAAPQHDRRG